MAKGAKELVRTLSEPGRHDVLRGDLALVGLPGVVFTPERGLGLPAVAVGHGWLQPAARYAAILRHLASWGVVALCPDTQRGPLPSSVGLATDLRTALDVATGVRLGTGDLSVDPARLGLVGHGTGGGAAILAAAADDRVRAVGLLSPAETLPSAIDAARSVTVPALIFLGGRDNVAPVEGHGGPIASAWGGPSSVRTMTKASHLGYLDSRHWTDAFVEGKPQKAIHKLTLALLTAFVLRELTGTDRYDELLESDVKGAVLLQPAA